MVTQVTVNFWAHVKVVGLDKAFGLGPPHVNGGLPVWNHFSCCDEEGS